MSRKSCDQRAERELIDLLVVRKISEFNFNRRMNENTVIVIQYLYIFPSILFYYLKEKKNIFQANAMDF